MTQTQDYFDEYQAAVAARADMQGQIAKQLTAFVKTVAEMAVRPLMRITSALKGGSALPTAPSQG